MTSESKIPVIAIDGPSGTGKGTLCQRLADRLGWHLLDSGAIYRVLALDVVRKRVDFSNVEALQSAARGLQLSFQPGPDGIRVLLAGEDVTGAIRTEEAGNAASRVAAVPAVRAALLDRQRAFQRAPGLIADGRDMGTVVFPAAALKVFLTASAEERAKRRYNQLKQKGQSVSLPALLEDITERDERDRARSVSPLVPAADARLLDTTKLDIESVFARVMEWIEELGLVRRV